MYDLVQSIDAFIRNFGRNPLSDNTNMPTSSMNINTNQQKRFNISEKRNFLSHFGKTM